MDELSKKLEELSKELMDRDHDLLVMADKTDNPDVLKCVAFALLNASEALLSASKTVSALKKEASENKDPSEEALETLAALAGEFDKSEDPELVRQASVFDEILRTIGGKEAFQKAKEAEAKKYEDLRKSEKEAERDPWNFVKEEFDKQNSVAETQKAVKEQVKQYRPMEAPLQTRYCPDHPGAQMARVAEHVYQCSLDKAIYNYQAGYTTLKGNKVPGGDLSLQTVGLNDLPPDHVSFQTRESRLNRD